MIVEIAGLVGSGKSSVTAELRDLHPQLQLGWSLSRPVYMTRLVHSIVRCAITARWFRPTGLERPWYMLKLIWHLDAQLEVLAREKPALRSVVLFEEGPIFKLCWISVCAREAGIAGAAFERWCARMEHRCAAVVDRVAWLDAPDEVLLGRVRSRPRLTGYGLKHKPDPEAYHWLKRYRTTYQRILTSLAAEHGVEVVSFDTVQNGPAEIAASLTTACNVAELAFQPNGRMAGDR